MSALSPGPAAGPPPEQQRRGAARRAPKGRINPSLRYFLIAATLLSALACCVLALLFWNMFGPLFLVWGTVYGALGVALCMAKQQRLLAMLAGVSLAPVAFVLFILSLW